MAVASKKKKIFDKRYEILSIVGRGARSVVYHARYIDGEREEVALKVLLDKREGVTPSDLLRKEALAMVSSRHKYVIRLDDFHSLGDLCYLTMELARGGDLRQYLKKKNGKLSATQTELFLLQAGEALDFIHKAGILHRDLKPENILVVDDQNIRIGDFGVAILPGEKSSLEELRRGVGTLEYLCPEALEGAAYDKRSDLYALGVTFYELLSGTHPFSDATLAEQVDARRPGNYTPIADLQPDAPAHLLSAISRLMSFKPESRFQSARELIQALVSFDVSGLDGEAPSAESATTQVKPTPTAVEVAPQKAAPEKAAPEKIANIAPLKEPEPVAKAVPPPPPSPIEPKEPEAQNQNEEDSTSPQPEESDTTDQPRRNRRRRRRKRPGADSTVEAYSSDEDEEDSSTEMEEPRVAINEGLEDESPTKTEKRPPIDEEQIPRNQSSEEQDSKEPTSEPTPTRLQTQEPSVTETVVSKTPLNQAPQMEQFSSQAEQEEPVVETYQPKGSSLAAQAYYGGQGYSGGAAPEHQPYQTTSNQPPVEPQEAEEETDQIQPRQRSGKKKKSRKSGSYFQDGPKSNPRSRFIVAAVLGVGLLYITSTYFGGSSDTPPTLPPELVQQPDTPSAVEGSTTSSTSTQTAQQPVSSEDTLFGKPANSPKSFPLIPAGVYSGQITFSRSKETVPFSLISLQSSQQLIMAVGIHGF
ncbi:MAG: protein kinase, partial [Bdellovibrionales bacterium]|nr:protein kinase [Bdellovibrionales bacterium]